MPISRAFQVREQIVVFRERDTQLAGKLPDPTASAPGAALPGGLPLPTPRPLRTKLPRAPVEGTKRVEDGARGCGNWGVGLETACFLSALYLVAGVDEADRAGGDQVVKLHMLRQALVDLARPRKRTVGRCSSSRASAVDRGGCLAVERLLLIRLRSRQRLCQNPAF